MEQICLEFLAICYTHEGLREKMEESRVAGREGEGGEEERSGKRRLRLPQSAHSQGAQQEVDLCQE